MASWGPAREAYIEQQPTTNGDLRDAWYVRGAGAETPRSAAKSARRSATGSASGGRPDSGFQRRRRQLFPDESPLVQLLSRRSLLWYAVMLAALGGLIWQLQDISSLYFQYKTVTELRVKVPSEIEAPSLSVCFPYFELMDHKRLLGRYPLLPHKNGTFTLADLQTIVTIKDIFDLTPGVEALMDYCLFRKPKSYTRELKNNLSCGEIFHVEKYYKQQYCCYVFTMKSDASLPSEERLFSFDYVQNSLISPGMFYEVDLIEAPFHAVNNIQAVIHAPGVKPRGNKAFPVSFSRVSSVIPLKGREPVTLRDSYFFLSYSMFVNVLLKAPYNSRCVKYERLRFESQEDCIDECVIDATKFSQNKVPFTAVSNRSVDEHHISQLDNANPAITDKLDQITATCNAQCASPNCHDEIYVTKFIRSESSVNLAFRVYVANEPTLESTFKARIQLPEFMVYLLSCFGIWFGISFYSFVAVFDSFAEHCQGRRSGPGKGGARPQRPRTAHSAT